MAVTMENPESGALPCSSGNAPPPSTSHGSGPGIPSSDSTHNSSSEPDMTEDVDSPEDVDIDWDAFDQLTSPNDTSKLDRDTMLPENGDCLEADNDQGLNTRKDSVQDTRPSIEAALEHDDISHFDVDDLDPEFMKRQLRPQKRAFPTTWMDTDKTSNYDPVEDERELRLKRRRVHVTRTRRSASKSSNKFEHVVDVPLPERPQLVVALKITTPIKKDKLIRLLSNIGAAEQSEKAGYKLRIRAKALQRNGDYRNADNMESAHRHIDFRAKPFARGCWGCVDVTGRDSASMCSLVHDEREWPCQICLEDGHDCELILPPVQKRPCEGCKKKKAPCSFKTTRNHGESCDQCLKTGFKCIAGPMKDVIRPRIRLDRDWVNDPLLRKKGKGKAPQDCLECRQAGGPCTYPDVEGAPCLDCKWAGLPCTIGEGREPTPLADTFDFEALASRAFPQKPTTKPAAPSTNNYQKPRGELRTISTNFSHPILFNCDENGEANDVGCHFCLQPSLALIGFGLKQDVEVIDWDDGRPFTETQNCHHGDGIESTRLCTSCTTARLLVCVCARHEMRPIPGVNTSPERQDQALNALLENESTDLSAFCSLCPTLAAYECAATQEDSGGCGLSLCEPCTVTLEGQHDGDLKALLRNGRMGEPQEGLRADCEFLKADGALMRHLGWLSIQ